MIQLHQARIPVTALLGHPVTLEKGAPRLIRRKQTVAELLALEAL